MGIIEECPGGGMVDACASEAYGSYPVEVRVFSWAPNGRPACRQAGAHASEACICMDV